MNKVIIVTAPSGAGKTTIVRHLLEHNAQLAFSVSATTREKRINEIDGIDYYFISEEEFKNKVAQNAFLEHEEVYKGTSYGTLKSEVDRLWSCEKVVVFDIDVEGALNIKKQLGNNALSIFIMPPNKETLIERLKNRKTETEEKIKMRIDKADKELSYAKLFDACIINDDLPTAIDEAQKLVTHFIKS